MFRYTKSVLRILKLANNVLENTGTTIDKVLRNGSKSSAVIPLHVKAFCTNVNNNSEDENAEPNFAEITQGDPELEHKLKVLLLELDVSRQDGRLVPKNSSMKTQYWKELLKLPSISARRKYLLYLFKLEKTKENELKRKAEKRLKRELEPQPKKEDNALNYDLGHNHMFLRFYDTTINTFYNGRLVQAMLYGQKLVVDCGYNEYMTDRENKNCAKQLLLLFAENRFAIEPFDLHFCNVDRESTLIKTLHKGIPTMYETAFPLNLYSGSYLDHFPKDKLVYLTPHCREVLHEFDHDAIYIIGGIVDKVNNEPLSLAKAKKEGIRMAKLPLDQYLDWGSGSGKSLTINQVISILNDIKTTGNWKEALKHVPRRKLADFNRDEEVRKFNQSIGYTAASKNFRDVNRKPWRPSSNTNDFENVRSNKTNRISGNVRSLLKDDE